MGTQQPLPPGRDSAGGTWFLVRPGALPQPWTQAGTLGTAVSQAVCNPACNPSTCSHGKGCPRAFSPNTAAHTPLHLPSPGHHLPPCWTLQRPWDLTKVFPASKHL